MANNKGLHRPQALAKKGKHGIPFMEGFFRALGLPPYPFGQMVKTKLSTKMPTQTPQPSSNTNTEKTKKANIYS